MLEQMLETESQYFSDDVQSEIPQRQAPLFSAVPSKLAHGVMAAAVQELKDSWQYNFEPEQVLSPHWQLPVLATLPFVLAQR
jgi:hypothetical protein